LGRPIESEISDGARPVPKNHKEREKKRKDMEKKQQQQA